MEAFLQMPTAKPMVRVFDHLNNASHLNNGGAELPGSPVQYVHWECIVLCSALQPVQMAVPRNGLSSLQPMADLQP